jgi:nitrite reductase (NO-forming)
MLEVAGESRHDLYTEKRPDAPYEGRAIAMAAPAPVSGPITGEGTYKRICAACHQSEGQGVMGAFPPLAKSDYLADAPKQRLADHIINGLQGPLTVNGGNYNGVMPPMGFLTDEEIAKALTFVRASWGNNLDAVTTDDVARARKGK